MNDPNGMIFRAGRLHAFYQHNPDAPFWDRISWGHAASSDLVNWERLPVAIEPAPDGPDSFGCWSGSIVDADGTPTMLYTGVVEVDGIRRASICLAHSTDGMTSWTRPTHGPVVVGPPPGFAPDMFRDPFVWRDGSGWLMLVGAGAIPGVESQGEAGTVLIYRSADLVEWAYLGPFLTAADLPPTLDAGGPCWECPQLVQFGDRAVLILSIMDPSPESQPSHVIGIAGRVDGDRFIASNVVRLDAGSDFYAPAVAVDPAGRPLLLGWVPEDPPPAGHDRDWAGSMTTPRIVSLDGDDVTILPVPEFRALRRSLLSHDPQDLGIDEPPWESAAVPEGPVEIVCWIGAADRTRVTLELRDHRSRPEAQIVFDSHDRHLSITRRGSVDAGGPIAETSFVVPARSPGDHGIDLRLLIDGSMLEVFVDDRTSATFRLPTADADGDRRIEIAASTGRATVRLLDIWTLDGTPDHRAGHMATSATR
jgi:beta-fructofuranosidase